MPDENQFRMIKTPLYQQAAEFIRKRYVLGKEPGLRLPSESELEKLLKVSMITVRSALRELEAQQWIERRHGSGTYVRERNTDDRHVALLLEADVSNPRLSPFYLKQLQELRVELMKHRMASRPYLGHLCPGVEIGELTCRDFFDDLKRDRISGVIAVLACRHPSWVDLLERRSIPLVGSLSSGVIQVDMDRDARIEAILAHFQSRGYRQLGCIENDFIWAGKSESRVRWYDAVQRMAPRYGLQLDASAIRLANGSNPDESREAILHIWNHATPRPDAFIILSDVVFTACTEAIQNQKGGESVGFGSWGSDAVNPVLLPNTVFCNASVAALAQAKVERMRQLLRHEPVPTFTPVPFTLQFGEMTSPAPQEQKNAFSLSRKDPSSANR